MGKDSTQSLQGRFYSTLNGNPAKVAITYGERDYLWGELATLGRRLVGALDAAQVLANTAIAIVARNHPSAVAAILALMARGHRLILIDPLQRGDRLAAIVAELEVAAIVIGQIDYSDAINTAANTIDAAVLMLGDIDEKVSVLRPAGTTVRIFDNDELGVEIATSGTTGTPKRILYSYRSCADTGRDACVATQAMLPEGHDLNGWPIIQIFPIAHIGGFYYILQLGWGGQHQVMLEKFAVDPWVAAVERFHPPLLWVHPPGIRMLIEADLPSETLRGAIGLRTGSAPLESKTRDIFTQRYGVPIIGYFGATEYCGIVTDWTYADIVHAHKERPLSVGRVRPGVHLRIVKPDNPEQDCLPDEIGRLNIKVDRISPNWFKTNDLARLDAEGFLYLEGRADSVINRGGFKVSCVRVAEVLRTHPAVGDILVLAMSDQRLGEVPAAAIEIRAGSNLSLEQIQDFARERLLSYEVPAKFLLSRSLPRASLEKISQEAVLKLLEIQ